LIGTENVITILPVESRSPTDKPHTYVGTSIYLYQSL